MHCLTGHDDTVASILTQSTDPQVTLSPGAHPVSLLSGWDKEGTPESLGKQIVLRGQLPS